MRLRVEALQRQVGQELTTVAGRIAENRRIDDAVGATSSLASEIWRAFLIAMVLALLLEALLCLPETKSVVEPPRTVVANPVNVQQAGSA